MMKPNDGFAKLKQKFITGCCEQGLNHEDLLFRLFLVISSVAHLDDPSQCIEIAINDYKRLRSLKDNMHAVVANKLATNDPDNHEVLIQCHDSNRWLLHHYAKAIAGEAKIKIEE